MYAALMTNNSNVGMVEFLMAGEARGGGVEQCSRCCGGENDRVSPVRVQGGLLRWHAAGSSSAGCTAATSGR